MKRTLACCTLLFIANISAAERLGLPGAVVPDPFGVNIHFVVPDEAEADAIAAGGFKFVRMDFAWEGVEKKTGVYDFSGYDKLVEGMNKRGIRLVLILDYAHRLYDGGLSPHTDAGRAAFAKFAGAAAAHFAGKNILWEIWNEPNIGFWKPKPNAEDYAALALATIEAVRKGDPDAHIQGPASSEFPWEFFKVLGERGVLAKLDAVSVHPYRQNEPERVITDYLRLRGLIDQYSPKKHIPIVSGEWGYSTAWGGMKGSNEKQAQFLVRQWLTNLSCGVGPSIWYDWRDDGSDPKEPEHHFGSVFRDMKPKPAYLAAQVLCNTLRGYRFIARVSGRSDEDYMLVFEKSGEIAMALWTSARDHAIGMNVDVKIDVVSMDGKRRVRESSEKELALSGAPQYLLFPKEYTEKMNVLVQPLITIASVRAGTHASVPVELENLLETDLASTLEILGPGEVLGSVAVALKAKERKTFSVPVLISRRDKDTLRVEIKLQQKDFAASAWLHVSNAIHIDVLPGNEKSVPVVIENPSGEALEMKLQVQGGEAQGSAGLILKEGQREAVVLIALEKAPQAGAALSVVGLDGKGTRVAASSEAQWRMLRGVEEETGWRTQVDGNEKIAGSASIGLGNVPEAVPGMEKGRALELKYKFDAGWRFAMVPAPAGMKKVEGNPQTLGVWLYGDGSENSLRCRFVDKSGQTFQPSFGPILWKGWRFVTMKLTGEDAGHWGGANDGIVHYPIQWDTLLLIDSIQRKMDVESTLYVTGFSVK